MTHIDERDGLRWIVEPGTDDILGPEHEAGIEAAVLGLLPERPADGWAFPAGPGTLLDIGAHVGHYTLRAARAGHAVIAVEANPETAGRLLANVVLNGLDGQVTIIPHPAWDDYEALRWKGFHEGSMAVRNGSGRVYPDPGGDLWPVILDDVIPPGRAVDVVKIDTEGAELRVLRGLRATLKRCRPVMWIEDHAWTGAYRPDELTGLLAELHYTQAKGGEWSGLTYWRCDPV
jgi:FkbM family methyltransferase